MSDKIRTNRIVRPMTLEEQQIAATTPTLPAARQLPIPPGPPAEDPFADKRDQFEAFFGLPPSAKNYQGSATPDYRLARQRYYEMLREFDRNIASFEVERLPNDTYTAEVFTWTGAQPTPGQLRAFLPCLDFCKIFASPGILAHRPTRDKNAGQGFNYWLALHDVSLLKVVDSDGPTFSVADKRPLLIPMDHHFINPDGVDETAIRIVSEWIEAGIPVRLKSAAKLPQELVQRNLELLEQLGEQELEELLTGDESDEPTDIFAGL